MSPGKGHLPCPWPCQGSHHVASSPWKPCSCSPPLSRCFLWCCPSVSKALNMALHKVYIFANISDLFPSSRAIAVLFSEWTELNAHPACKYRKSKHCTYWGKGDNIISDSCADYIVSKFNFHSSDRCNNEIHLKVTTISNLADQQ